MIITRLARAIARAGVTSRRKAEELITRGLVEVNGAIVTEVATEVDLNVDLIHVRGKWVKPERKVYILLNKPAGYISSVTDPHGRDTVLNLLPNIKERVFPVGRLDSDTTGLILLTNDGEFANLMTHPRYEIKKIYQALVEGRPDEDVIKRLLEGIIIDGRKTASARARVIRFQKDKALVELEIHEGRKHQVKKMMAELGHPVIKLKRVGLGGLDLTSVKEGGYRFLTPVEVDHLKQQALMTSSDEKSSGGRDMVDQLGADR